MGQNDGAIDRVRGVVVLYQLVLVISATSTTRPSIVGFPVLLPSSASWTRAPDLDETPPSERALCSTMNEEKLVIHS
jgi:hypothetical protein